MSWKSLRSALGALLALVSLAAAAAEPKPRAGDDPDTLVTAVVKIKTRAIANARTLGNLGDTREGTGIVIDELGHVLTIGYLVVEADTVEITLTDGRVVAANPVAYDSASGFGLVKASLPLDAKPIELGASDSLRARDPVMVLSHGGRDTAKLAMVLARRPFTGSWEYLLDSAIITIPPAPEWAGSALIDREGRLVGVGALLLQIVLSDDTPALGNMFVPTDLLKPILADLIAAGHSSMPPRPWLGISTEEIGGHVVVSLVSPDGPGDLAGVHEGDIVLGVGAEQVIDQADFYRKVWKVGSAGVEVPLRMLSGTDVREVRLRSIDRSAYFRSRPTY